MCKKPKITVGNCSDLGFLEQRPPQDFSGGYLSKETPIKTRTGNTACSEDGNMGKTRDLKSIYSQNHSTKAPEDAVTGSSNKQVIKPLSRRTSYREVKTPKTILLEDITQSRCRVRSSARRYSDVSFHLRNQENALPLIVGRTSAKVSAAGSLRATQVITKPTKGSGSADIHRSSLCTTKGRIVSSDKVETTENIKDSGILFNAMYCFIMWYNIFLNLERDLAKNASQNDNSLSLAGTAYFHSPDEITRADIQDKHQPSVLVINKDGRFSNRDAPEACWK